MPAVLNETNCSIAAIASAIRASSCVCAVTAAKSPGLPSRAHARPGAKRLSWELKPPSNTSRPRVFWNCDFRVKETYSKVREEYRLDGCAICLDHIPTAGWFVEIEGSQRKIRQIAHLLGLRGTDREHRSYRKLIKENAI